MTREERIRREQGRRLAMAREAAGYRSARAAALDNEWPESSYRAHEGGTRTIGLDDAERYAKRFRAAGVNVSAQSILFGTGGGEHSQEYEERIIQVLRRLTDAELMRALLLLETAFPENDEAADDTGTEG